MNKARLVEIVSEKFKLSKKISENIIEAIFDESTKALSNGEKVSIVGFGSFISKVRGGYNAKTILE